MGTKPPSTTPTTTPTPSSRRPTTPSRGVGAGDRGQGGDDGCTSPSSRRCRATELEALQLERLRRRCGACTRTCRCTAPSSTRRASTPPRVDVARRPARASRSRSRTTCAPRTRTACSPRRCATSCACTRSSGTTGQITVVGYTQGDIDRWSDLMARTFACAGAHRRRRRAGHLRLRPVHRRPRRALRVRAPRRAHDPGLRRQHEAPGPDPEGLRRDDARVHAQLRAAHRRDRRARWASTSATLPLRVGVFGAEPWSENMRRQIEDALGITAIDIYGLSEVHGPGRRLRVRAAERPARLRGPLPHRDRRPRDARAGARRRAGRGRLHDAHQGRHPGRPLPDARHLAHHPRRRARAAGRSGGWSASPAAPTTCSSSAA